MEGDNKGTCNCNTPPQLTRTTLQERERDTMRRGFSEGQNQGSAPLHSLHNKKSKEILNT
jgi:hypothetical protein